MKNMSKSTYLLTQCTISQRLRLVVFNGTFNNIFSYIVGKNNPIHYPYPHSYVLFNYLPPLPMKILDVMHIKVKLKFSLPEPESYCIYPIPGRFINSY